MTPEQERAKEELFQAPQGLRTQSDEAEQRAAQLQTLASEITLAEQRERRRLAQILHDHLQQILVAAKMHMGSVSRKIKDDALARSLREIDSLLDQSIAESRSLTVELSPPVLHERGLVAALEWLATHFQAKYRLPVCLELCADAEPADDGTRVFLFQASRELLFNCVKHAQAQWAQVCLSRRDGGCIQLIIADDGRGFDPSIPTNIGVPGGFGLRSIRERLAMIGGRLEIFSEPGKGTRMVIDIPQGRASCN